MKPVALLTAISISISLSVPSYARGGGFHGGGGGGFGGGRSLASGGGGRAGGARAGGGMRDQGGFGGRRGNDSFGGGFGNVAQSHAGRAGGNVADRSNFNRGGFDNHGLSNRPGANDLGRNNFANGNFANRTDRLPTDSGFGNLSNFKNANGNFKNFDPNNANWHNQDVRNSFNQYNVNNFNHAGLNNWGHGDWAHGNYWGYPGAWSAPGWGAATAWTCMGLTTLTSFLGIAAIAGSHRNSAANVVYEGPNVYVDGTPAGSCQDYYDQSQQLAMLGANYGNNNYYDNEPSYAPSAYAPNEQWQPLGVFSLVQQGQSQSSMIFQLAINQQGIVRGNYMNQLTNETQQVYGAMDRNTQRVSFSIGQDNNTVFDTTLSDLSQDEAPVLVHYGPDNTQGMMLVRLPQPQAT